MPKDGCPSSCSPDAQNSGNTVEYFTGEVVLRERDVAGGAFGGALAHARAYRNDAAGDFDHGQGWNWELESWPELRPSDYQQSDLTLADGGRRVYFRRDGAALFTLHGRRCTLTHDANAGEYVLTEEDGTRVRFHDLAHPTRPGGFIAATDAGGRVTQAVEGPGGRVDAVRRSGDVDGVAVTEELRYDRFDVGPHFGQLSAVTRRRQTAGGPWEPLFKVLYQYYADGDARGSLNDLKTAERFEFDGAAWASLGVRYYRYWTTDAGPGLTHGLRFVLKPESYARLAAAVGDPETAADAVLAGYADYAFKYDGRRVSEETVDGGSRTTAFAYADNPNFLNPDPADPNAWFRKTTQTRPDGSQLLVYCNVRGQTMLRVEREDAGPTAAEWVRYNRFDAAGRRVLAAAPSAVGGYDEALPDLIGYDDFDGSALFLRANDGVLTLTEYDADGLVSGSSIQRGTSGTPHPRSAREYLSYSDGGRTVHRVSKETTFREENGAGAVDTTFSYTFHPGTTRTATRTTHLPVVPAAEGGTGTADTIDEVFDEDGRQTFSRDARGTISHRRYDTVTGAVTQSVEDADPALLPDAPAGWSAPAGGGTHLVTDYEHDARGRVTATFGPEHEALVGGSPVQVRTASWTVYKDAGRETVSAAGYLAVADGSETLVNPISITTRDRNGNVVEEVSAVRSSTAGRPLASDVYQQSDYVAWTTHAYTDCCKLSATRVYHTIPASGEGVAGTHYDETTFGYDLRDRRDRAASPGGAISVTLFDTLGREVAAYVGTNDAGATAADPTGGGADPANDMVLLREHQYDGGADGADGNLTRTTVFVDAATVRVTRHEYDWQNRRVATLGEEQTCSVTAYDHLGRAVRTERRLGAPTGRLLAKSETRYDDRGRAHEREQFEVDYDTGAVGGSIVFATDHDAAGNVVREAPSGAADFVEYAYDALGRRVSETDPLNHARTTAYDDAGRAVSETDRTGHTSTRDYDPVGRLAAATDPLGNATTYGYDAAGRQSSVTDPRGHATTTAYDAAGRMVSTTDPLGHAVTVGYDADGHQSAVTDPLGRVTTHEYDHRGRLVRTTDPGGAVTEQSHNRAGDLLTETDAKGNDTVHAYDGLGRRTATTDRLNHTTTFAFDALDRQVALTDAEGGVTTYAFDGFGRPASTTWPDHAPGSVAGDADYGVTTALHDDRGRLIRQTDQLGDTVTHVYDAAGRRTTRVYRAAADSPSGPVADQDDFTYDDEGRLLTATKGRYANTIGYVYDAAGRISSESLTTDGQTYTIGRGYDASGNLDRLTYPDGTVVDRPHDARGLLDRVDSAGSLVADFGYDAAGRETTRTFGNGLVTTTSYVPNENLLQGLATPGVGTYAYAYDDNKNRTAETITGPMSGYGYTAAYDAEDRLVGWDRTDGLKDQDWTLSSVGDWDQYVEEGVTQTRTHNAVHELTGIDGQALTYDPKGNLTADHLGRGFVWDQDNMLRSCTVAPGASVGQEGTHFYAYDAIGRRVSKTVDNGDGTFTTTVFGELTLPIPPLGTPGGQTLCEYAAGAAAASPQRSYAFGAYCDEPLVMDDGTATYYYHRDGRYSIIAVTDDTGAVEERYVYTSTGHRLASGPMGASLATGSLNTCWGFTGHRNDKEQGLSYVRARALSHRIGAFVSRDPLAYMDSLNAYAARFISGGVDPSGTLEVTARCKKKGCSTAFNSAGSPLGRRDFPKCPKIRIPFYPNTGRKPCPLGWILEEFEGLPKSPEELILNVGATLSAYGKCEGCSMRDLLVLLSEIESEAAKTVETPGVLDPCERWSEGFKKRISPAVNNNPCVYQSDSFKVFDVGLLGSHVVYRIVLCDGSLLYVDNGVVGGGDHVGLPTDVPYFSSWLLFPFSPNNDVQDACPWTETPVFHPSQTH